MSGGRSPRGGSGLGGRLSRAARLGAVSARTSAGWLAGAVIQGIGRSVLGRDFADLRAHLRVPGDLVFVIRTLAGMYMVLSRLGATAPWRRIAREYLCGEPPSTPLGVAERAWAERRASGP